LLTDMSDNVRGNRDVNGTSSTQKLRRNPKALCLWMNHKTPKSED